MILCELIRELNIILGIKFVKSKNQVNELVGKGYFGANESLE